MPEEISAPAWMQLAKRMLLDDYGIEGVLTRLPGENRNYLVNGNTGNQFVLKIIFGAEASLGIEVQSEVMRHALANRFSAQLPTTIPNKNSRICTPVVSPDGNRHCAQLMEFVSGDLLQNRRVLSTCLLQSLGRVMAEFDRSLEGYDHAYLHRGHMWNITVANQHIGKIPLLTGQRTRRNVEWAFDRWSRAAQPHFSQLPQQPIHGDLNPENVLVAGNEVCGLVDLTDCCFNPKVCELALCLPYLMMNQENPIEVAKEVIRGYRTVGSLNDLEVEVLVPLICARLAVTLCVAAWRRTIDPAHPNWFGSESAAQKLLQFLRDSSCDQNALLWPERQNIESQKDGNGN